MPTDLATDRRAQGIAIPLVGFVAAFAALILIVVMTDTLVEQTNDIALNATNNSAAETGLKWRQTIWENVVWIGLVVLSVSLIMAGILLGDT